MADRSVGRYQKHESEPEDTEDSESSSTDSSSDSLDLNDSELEISVASQYDEDMEQCEVYSNPNIDCNDSKQYEDSLKSNPHSVRDTEERGACGGLVQFESHSNKNIDKSEAVLSNRDSANLSQEISNIGCSQFDNVFPLNLVHRRLNKQRNSEIKIVAVDASVYLTAVIEYIVREVLDLAVSCAHISKRTRIKTSDVAAAIQYDDDMSKLFKELKVGVEDPQLKSSSTDPEYLYKDT